MYFYTSDFVTFTYIPQISHQSLNLSMQVSSHDCKTFGNPTFVCQRDPCRTFWTFEFFLKSIIAKLVSIGKKLTTL